MPSPIRSWAASPTSRARGSDDAAPYFLIGALPFGLGFAALWIVLPDVSEPMRFAYYTAAYAFHTIASTVLSVPYMALLPELTLDYEERTSLSTYRSAASVVGTILAAVMTKPAVDALGGGARGFLIVGCLYGVWLALPWGLVFLRTRERPEFQREPRTSFLDGLRLVVRHRAYRTLMALYLCSRIAMDVVAAMLIFYFTYWLARPKDFELAMGLCWSQPWPRCPSGCARPTAPTRVRSSSRAPAGGRPRSSSS